MIALRDMRPEDRAQVLGWRNMRAVADTMYTDHVITVDEHAAWFDRVLADPSCRYWIITCEGADVGLACITGIDCRHGRCTLGLYVARSGMRGRGIGTAATFCVLVHVFDRLELEKLCCEVLDSNVLAHGMYKRLGLREERRLRRHLRKGDTWHDVIAMAICREEWQATRPEIEARLMEKSLLSEATRFPATG